MPTEASVMIEESISNDCLAGKDRTDQSWRKGRRTDSQGPIGEDQHQALGLGHITCGLRQEVETRAFSNSLRLSPDEEGNAFG